MQITSEAQLRKEATALLKKGTTASEFSAYFFGPNGKLTAMCSSSEERKALTKTELYRSLQKKLATLRSSESQTFEDETQSVSGRVTIVIPKSLHHALKMEASSEGVSLSELMRLKLAVKFSQSAARLPKSRRKVANV